MPTLNFKAVKMSDAKVSHISLVERGANRIPFRIVKQENQGMSKGLGSLDLGNLFARKAEKPQPEIVGVVTMKGEGLDELKSKIAEAGFAVTDVSEAEDGSVVFKQGEIGEDVTIVRTSEQVALVVKGFSPYNMDITQDGVSFADLCAANGFYPGINTIMETLASSVRSVVYAAASPDEAKKGVSKLFSEAQAYISAYMGSLPVKAFKMEGLAVAVAQKADDTVETTTTDIAAAGAVGTTTTDETVEKGAKKPDDSASSKPAEGSKTGECDDPEKKKQMGAKKDEATTKGQTETVTEQVTEKALTKDDVAAIVGDHVTKAMSSLTESIQGLVAGFGEVKKSMADVTGQVSEFSGRVEKAEQGSAKALEALAGTVVHGGGEGDDTQVTQKSERVSAGRDFDTAFMPRRPFPR